MVLKQTLWLTIITHCRNETNWYF